ncbi:hypothetical protein MVEG_03638 [Podila verticillata NRRL 6337]|nr:hypothetical protein MVEG_03638 [Podila verticillata NRRL 6337]
MRFIFRRSLLKQWTDLNPLHGQALPQRITGHHALSWSQKSPEVPLQVLSRYNCTRSAHTGTMAQETKPVAPNNKTSRSKSWSQSKSTKIRQDDKSSPHRPSDRWATAPLRRTDHAVRNTTRRSFQPTRFPQSGENTTRHQGQRWPTIFRPYAETERIEGLDTLSVQQVFTQRAGSRTIRSEAFSVKVCRMPFRKPPTEHIPIFVQKANREYEAVLAEYNKRLATLDSTSSTVPSPPKPLPFIVQYRQRNLRLYPESQGSPHPAFRVTYVVSKKLVSKLAIHRNLARKKLSAAVESTFKEHARPGYEYLIFAAQKVVTTPQEMLIKMMKNVLTNPGLYSEPSLRADKKLKTGAGGEHENSGSIQDKTRLDSKANEAPQTEEKSPILMRWKNNRPPIYKNWWKHAMPNPLGRTNQPTSYLDMFCPESQEGLTPFREQEGRIKALRRRKQLGVPQTTAVTKNPTQIKK